MNQMSMTTMSKSATTNNTGKQQTYQPTTHKTPRALMGLTMVLSLLMLAPFMWAVGLSLKDNGELMRGTGAVFEFPYTLQNYLDIFENSSVFQWLINSLIVSCSMTVGILVLSSGRIRLRSTRVSVQKSTVCGHSDGAGRSGTGGDHCAPPDFQ